MNIQEIRNLKTNLLSKIEEYKKNEIFISPVIENDRLVCCEVFIESEKYLGILLNQTNIGLFRDFVNCLDLIDKNKTDLKTILTQSDEEYKKANYYKSISLINSETRIQIENYIREKLYKLKDNDIVIIPEYCNKQISSISIRHLFNGVIEEATIDNHNNSMDADIALTFNYLEALNMFEFEENEEVEEDIKDDIELLLDPIYPHNTVIDLTYDLITAREKFEVMFLKSLGLFLREVFE